MSWRPAVFLAGLVLMLLWEGLVPARPWRAGRGRRLAFHLGVGAFNTALMRWALVPPLLAWAAFVRAKGWGAAGLLGLSGWTEIAVSLAVLDLLDYWWHRMNHRVAFFWRFHRAHHSDTELDATTSLRFHFGELVLSGGMKALWLLAWGPSPLAFVLFETAITACAQFHHANVDLGRAEPPVRLLLMTPRLHAAHHTASRRTRDMNFSTIFLLWDRLFGTLAEATREELEVLGLPEGRAGALSPRGFLASPVRLGP
ncbi:MAG: sterol desaturase family protein [Elusimicrobia bacterium]|nr:sterol desaturase family protein [Elusimicrobiota bacterium]